MMENGKRRARRQLTPEEKWEVFLEVTSQEISQADAARKYGVDVSVIIRLRALAKDAALAAFASAKPGRPASAEAVEVELAASLRKNCSLEIPSTVSAIIAAGTAPKIFRGERISYDDPLVPPISTSRYNV